MNSELLNLLLKTQSILKQIVVQHIEIIKNRIFKICKRFLSFDHPMNNQANNHVQFMAQLSAQMAKFFMSVTEMCISEIRKHRNPGRAQEFADQNSPLQRNNETYEKQMVTIKQQKKEISLPIRQSPLKIQKKQCSFQDQNGNKKIIIPELQQGIEKRKGRPRTKAITVTHKPKAPTSSFLLFLHQKKNEIAEKHNISNNSQLTRMASEEWKKLSEVEKSRYHKLSEEEQIRYHGAMKIYKEQYAQQIKQERKKKQVQYKLKWLQKKKAEKSVQNQKLKVKPLEVANESNNSSSSSNSYQSSPDIDSAHHQQQLSMVQNTISPVDKNTNFISLLQKKINSI